uniref:Ubiquitin carboxyl-terminal hydrolase n=1 Tax=Globodera rostochiensis TaxID=31243 RepID=A0A914H9X3_GLORO
MENDVLMENEDEVSWEVCWKIYQLDEDNCQAHTPPKRKTQNCKKNPYCLHRLGLEKFDKLLSQSQQTHEVLVRRDPSKQPCGLTNAGNFCYVNSFLQIWFNDLKFRQCVYNWRPSADWTVSPTAKLDAQTVMNCLQQLFIAMQFTPFEATNADDFIQLLRLDNQQQDVQEFHTLFFGTIERTLEAHANGRPILEGIRQLFQSRISQTICCGNCYRNSVTDGEYRSLQIGIDGHDSLISAIQSFFAAEPLIDYRCDQCGESGSVTRSSRFTQLPEVLIIQLNRYVFSSNGNLRKLQNAINYPRVLSNEELQRDVDGVADYELCAVMIHEGKSTNSGHYYDIIRDPVIGRWFTYNDEKVTVKRSAPGYSGKLTHKPHASADVTGCYALIYRRVGSDLRGPVQLPADTILTEAKKRLEDDFTRQNDEGDLAFNIWKRRIGDRSTLLRQIWIELEVSFILFWNFLLLAPLLVHNGSTFADHADDIAFLPTTLLTDILEKEFNAVEECKSVDSTYTPSPISDVAIALCEHNRVPPGPIKRGELKVVNTSAARELIKELNVNLSLRTGADICLDCVSKVFAYHDPKFTNAYAEGRRCFYPEGADIYIRLKGDESEDIAKNNNKNLITGPAAAVTRRAASRGLIKVRMCSDETIDHLKVRIYERTKQSPVDQLLYRDEQALEGNWTLEKAEVPSNNIDCPLILIVQLQNEVVDVTEQTAGVGGFGDTALS